MQRLALAVALCLSMGCSLLTVKQDPFPTMTVTAAAPEPPPPPPEEPKRVEVTDSKIKITEKVQFAYNSADIEEASFGLLDEIAKVMQDNPKITKVQVEGHTDSSGSAKYNRKLSKKRAQSVVKYLVGKGVAKKRLKAVGFGPDRPIEGTPGDSDDQRRVEFNIIAQGAAAEGK